VERTELDGRIDTIGIKPFEIANRRGWTTAAIKGGILADADDVTPNRCRP